MTQEQAEETALVIVEGESYVGKPINRAIVKEFGESLMRMHPGADDVGPKAMFAVAQLALVTGANPMPGTNGIHVWKDNKGRVNIQFGVGFWRGEAEKEGGILWLIPPRPMTEEERAVYSIASAQLAAICSGCLRKDALRLMRDVRDMDLEMSLAEAKHELARTGTGVVNPTEYAKAGRSLQWTADERAERDFLRKIVPVLQRARDNAINDTFEDGGKGWRQGDFVRANKPELQAPDGYTEWEANDDLIDYDDPTKRPERPKGVTEDGEIITPDQVGTPIFPKEDNTIEGEVIEVVIKPSLTSEAEEANYKLFKEVVDDTQEVEEEASEEEIEEQDEEVTQSKPVEELEAASIAEELEGPLSDIDQAIYDSNTMEEWIKLNLEAIPRYNVSQALHGALKKIGYASGFNEVPIITGRDKVPENIATKREKRLQISREIHAYAAKRDAEEA